MYLYAKYERRDIFWAVNIGGALFFGAVLYCLLHSTCFLSGLTACLLKLDGILPGKRSVSGRTVSDFCMFCGNFLLAYALTFSLGYVLKDRRFALRKTFHTAVGFELFMVLFQLFTRLQGRFDYQVIIADLLADLIAVFIILLRKRKYS